jgi:hypothetical protein
VEKEHRVPSKSNQALSKRYMDNFILLDNEPYYDEEGHTQKEIRKNKI